MLSSSAISAAASENGKTLLQASQMHSQYCHSPDGTSQP